MKRNIYLLIVSVWVLLLWSDLTIAQSFTVSPISLTGASGFTTTKFSGPSTTQSFTFSGTGLPNNGVLFVYVPPSGRFQSAYNTNATFTGGFDYVQGSFYNYSGTGFSNFTGVVRLRGSLDVGIYTAVLRVLNEATGAFADIPLSGTVTGLSTGPTSSLNNLTTYLNGASSPKAYTLVGQGISSNVSVSATNGFQISTDAASGFSNSITLSPTNNQINQVLYTRLTGISTGNKTGTITHTDGTYLTSISVSGQVAPTLVVNAARPAPEVLCSGTDTRLAVAYTGGLASYTVNWAGPGTITNASQATTTVSNIPAGIQTYTATITDASGQTVTATATVNVLSALSSSITSFQAEGTASCINPTRLSATAPGTSFIITGPGGYVFSNVYRTYGIYPVSSTGIKQGGQYTLTAFGPAGCPVQTSQLTVAGGTCP